MKVGPAKLENQAPQNTGEGSAPTPFRTQLAVDGIDLSLLEESLAKTPWQRMQANDDALRFADSLRAAVEKANARLERIDTETH